MKRDNVNYVLVGVVVLAALGLLLAALFVITGRAGAEARYYVEYGNVTGLGYGAPVFYEGYRIGQVADIEPQRTRDGVRYRVELAVREDWPIPSDSVAQLVSTGLLADVSIGIREGQSDRMLEPGSEIEGQAGADIFAAMNDLAGELTLLTRERIRPLVDKLGTQLESLSGTLSESAPEVMDEARQLLASLNRSATSLEEMLSPDNREAVSATLANVRQLSGDLQRTQARADELLASLNATVGENRPEIRRAIVDLGRTLEVVSTRIGAITHQLEASSRNLNEFSREIRRNPSRLIYTPPPDEVE